MATLEHVHHFPRFTGFWMWLENVGQDWPVYWCSFCKSSEEHGVKEVNGTTYAICLMCGEGSRVLDD